MSDPKNFDSPQVKLIRVWLDAVEKKDLAPIAKCLSEDYRNTIYPRSLGEPEQSKEEALEYAARVFNLWTEFETVHSITEAPGKVIFHASYTAKTTVGVNVSRESIWIQHIGADEDGSLKIKRGEEFTDSKVYLDGIQAVAAARAKEQ